MRQSDAAYITEEDKRRALALYARNGARQSDAAGSRLDGFLQARQRRMVVQQAAFAAGNTVLDVGAGLGCMVRAAKACGARVTAIDATPSLVPNLQDLADEAYTADLESFDDARVFDVVLCIGVLDFVTDPSTALAALAKRVAPGGRLVLLVPTASVGGQLYRFEKWLHGVRVNLFRPAFCVEHVERCGLACIHRSRPLPNNVLLTFKRAALD